MKKRGFTLLELMLVIALLAILMPATSAFFLHTIEHFGKVESQLRLSQVGSIALSECEQELSQMLSLNTASSVFGDGAEIVFQNNEGQDVILKVQAEEVVLSSNTISVNRLVEQVDGNVQYLTDIDLNVFQWSVERVYDSADNLTGLKISLTIERLNQDANVYQEGEYSSSIVVPISPQTTIL